ncbi:MAG: enoyl-CoA hydratase/isomerase family protein [Rhodospirillaceae bacterium]|nr:MAG: enoyl-CoA hydratase/isomerase family protein [Rhodospirillaceae bacterium]
MTTSGKSVLMERRGAVAIVTLNRPERRNGVTVEMCEELYQILRDLAPGDTRVIVIRGAGSDFSVGADLGGQSEAAALPTLAQLGDVFHAATLLHTMPQVTIAAIDGGCAGASMGWACACDFRFASDRAKFSTAFIKVGVSGDMGLIWSLARIVGGARARELLFFPEKVTAQEALEIGLVTRLFPADVLHQSVVALAEELAGRQPFALRMIKANLVSAEALEIRDYIEIESARHLHTVASSSFVDGTPASGQGKPSKNN